MRKEKIIMLIALVLFLCGFIFLIFRMYENKQSMAIYDAEVVSIDNIALKTIEDEGMEYDELFVSAVYSIQKDGVPFLISFKDSIVNPSTKDKSFYLSLEPGCIVTVYYDLSGYSFDNSASRYFDTFVAFSVSIVLTLYFLLSNNNQEPLCKKEQ